MNATQYADTAGFVRELTQHHTHAEPFQTHQPTGTCVTENHIVNHPPLITQLEHAITPSGSANSGARAAFGSAPAARLVALDTLARIDAESRTWLHTLEANPHGRLIRRVQRVHAASRNQHTDEADRAIRSWWVSARVTTGWDTPAWRPNNTCPLCGARGDLRVRLNSMTALCVTCRETWDPTTIGLLADHVRSENADVATESA